MKGRYQVTSANKEAGHVLAPRWIIEEGRVTANPGLEPVLDFRGENIY